MGKAPTSRSSSPVGTVHLFTQHLLSACGVPGSALGTALDGHPGRSVLLGGVCAVGDSRETPDVVMAAKQGEEEGERLQHV